MYFTGWLTRWKKWDETELEMFSDGYLSTILHGVSFKMVIIFALNHL